MGEPLTEKYRPRTLAEVTGNESVLECLKTFKIEDLPNMLFYGPPGTGKTTTIRALLRGHPPMNVIEMNASDDRGIDVIRERIKEFAQIKISGIKVVILDEADSMSRDAQGALRRVMEDYANTRFCLICNYSRKIIEPIISRCTRFRFSPVNEEGRIREVCLREGIKFTDEGIALINEYSDGDMRKVMNDIQGMRASYSVISAENVLEFFGLCDCKELGRIFDCLKKSSFDSCLSAVTDTEMDCGRLLAGLSELLIKSELVNKMAIAKELADIEARLAAGCSESIQTSAIVGAFISYR